MVRGRRRRRRRVGRAIELLLIVRDIGGGCVGGGLLLRLLGYQRLHSLNHLELIVPAEERPIGRRSLVLLRERARERDSEGAGRRGSERRDLVCTQLSLPSAMHVLQHKDRDRVFIHEAEICGRREIRAGTSERKRAVDEEIAGGSYPECLPNCASQAPKPFARYSLSPFSPPNSLQIDFRARFFARRSKSI